MIREDMSTTDLLTSDRLKFEDMRFAPREYVYARNHGADGTYVDGDCGVMVTLLPGDPGYWFRVLDWGIQAEMFRSFGSNQASKDLYLRFSKMLQRRYCPVRDTLLSHVEGGKAHYCLVRDTVLYCVEDGKARLTEEFKLGLAQILNGKLTVRKDRQDFYMLPRIAAVGNNRYAKNASEKP